MKSSNAARFATSKVGVLALTAILIFGGASMAAAQGNGNGGNPFNALWAAIGDMQVQIDSLAAGNTDLQALIDAEAAARASADDTLQNNIDAEAADRAAADNVLQNNVDDEAAARAAADSALYGNIDAEATARADADSALQSQINGISPGIVKGFYETAPSSQTAGPGGVALFGTKHCTNPDDKAINVSIAGSTSDNTIAGYIVLVNSPSGNGWFTLIRNAESESAEFSISLLCADIT